MAKLTTLLNADVSCAQVSMKLDAETKIDAIHANDAISESRGSCLSEVAWLG
jgi:hypothetical protein